MELFEIAAGSYEEFLLGYKFTGADLVQSFASHDHTSSIRSLAVGGPYLASGGADDRIIVYDMKTRRESCLLTHHDSTVNGLQFTHDNSHLISAGADGTLAVVKTGSWAMEKVWNKAHKGTAVLDVALHPSGKLALTLGADATLRTWNLIKGRQAFAVNLNSKSKDPRSLEKLLWGEDGEKFVIYGGQVTELWDIQQGGILKSNTYESKVSSCMWYSEDSLLVGLENGYLYLGSKKLFKAHDSRVKALAKHKHWIISASSAGEITVWDRNFEKLASVNSDCRITCMTIIKTIDTIKVKTDEPETEETVVEKSINNKKSSIVVEVEDDDAHRNDLKRRYRNTETEKEVLKVKKKKKRGLKDKSVETFEATGSSKEVTSNEQQDKNKHNRSEDVVISKKKKREFKKKSKLKE